MVQPYSEYFTTNISTLYYSDNHPRHGVAIVLDKETNRAVNGFVLISEAVMIL